MAEAPRLREQLQLDRVNWSKVLNLLEQRFKLPFETAQRTVILFIKRCRSAFHWHWFARKDISPDDYDVVLAICICHGADIIVLEHSRSFDAGLLRVAYRQILEFRPDMKARSESRTKGLGTLTTVIECNILGRKLEIRDMRGLVSLYIALVAVGVLVYVLAVGGVLYAASVILHFLVEPAATTLAATENPSILVALLAGLVGAAAIFGRATRNVLAKVVEILRRNSGS